MPSELTDRPRTTGPSQTGSSQTGVQPTASAGRARRGLAPVLVAGGAMLALLALSAAPLLAPPVLTTVLAVAGAGVILAIIARTARRRAGSEQPAVDQATGLTKLLAAVSPEPSAQRSATVLRDQADLIAACDAALANRDLVGGDVALAVFHLVDADTIVDRWGPDAVEDVGRQTVRRLRAWLPPQDTVARLSATTFAVLLEGLGDEGAGPQLTRLHALLAEPMASGEDLGEVDFAVGLAQRQDGSTGTELVLEALRATTRDEAPVASAEASGEEPVQTSPRESSGIVTVEAQPGGDPRLEQSARALADALRSGTVQAIFRPVLRLDDPTRMAAIQVLPRWNRSRGIDPGTSTLDPEQIGALAADAGLGAELRRQLAERGLDAVSSWYAAGFAVGRLALRIDQDALADPALPGGLTGHLERRHLPSGCLVVEVGAADLSDAALARPVLTALRTRGIEVVVTGLVAPQAALGLLTNLPMSGISLHRAVVDQLTGGSTKTADAANRAVAEAHRRGLRVIAEGVSSVDQLRRLRECGVDAAWGSAVAPAIRARDLSTRLSAERSLLLKD